MSDLKFALCALFILMGAASAHAGPAITTASDSPGISMVVSLATDTTPAMRDLMENQGCIPKGALVDGRLYANVSLLGTVSPGSTTTIRLNFCNDALLPNSFEANIQVEVDPYAPSLDRKNNLRVTLQKPDASFVPFGYYYMRDLTGMSWIHIKDRRLYGDSARQWYPIDQTGIHEVKITNPTSFPINVDNNLGRSRVTVAGPPAVSR